MDIAFAGFSLKVRERLLSGPGGPVEIGARAIDVLHVLLEKHSEVVSKDELLSTVWPGSIVEENALQAQISALRKSLGPSLIVTVHGRGYRYAGPPPRPMGGDAQTIEREDRKPVVAVLPFATLSADPDQQYFSDGITEDIIDRLSRFRNLAVIGSHTTFALRAAGTSHSGMTKRLAADYVVTGNVRRSGDHIRIAARLADAARETVLWAEHYDRPVGELFSIHDELAGIIASMLSRHVEADIGSRPPIEDVTSYELVLKGMTHFRNFSVENQEMAAVYFRRALEINPRQRGGLPGSLSLSYCAVADAVFA